MANKNSTRKALISSVLALVLCLSMLVGTTFAWFTDTATTQVNKIVAGNLDVVLEMKEGENWVSAEGKTLQFIKADGSDEVLWEPGATYKLPELRIRNNGNLALKYKVVISGINGDAELNNAIDWTITNSNGTTDLTTDQSLAATASDTLTISGTMQTTAGNEYQGKEINDITIMVYATQDTVESDSNNDQYDASAEYPNTVYVAPGVVLTDENTYEVSTADGLVWFEQQVNDSRKTFAGKTVKLTKDIDLAGVEWTPVGQTSGTQFKGTFDGNGHTIKNLNVQDTRNEDNGTKIADGVGLFGWSHGIIKDLTIDTAIVNGYHNVGAIAGYVEFGKVLNCTVKNSTVSAVHYGDNLCGDKVGAIAGVVYNVNADVEVTGCKVVNTTVSASRDAGIMVGAANYIDGAFAECTQSGSSVNKTVSDAGCAKHGQHIGDCLDKLVGRDI